MITKEEGYELIQLRKAKPKNMESLIQLEPEQTLPIKDPSIFHVFLFENGIKEINRNEAKTLVENGWATYISEVAIKMTIKRRQLIEQLLQKQGNRCQFCRTFTDCTMFKEPDKEESIVTPLNAICACPRCRTEQTEKNYFKWLNIAPSIEERTIKMTNYTHTKEYMVNETTAKRLVTEKMAKFITSDHICILYDRTNFRHYIKNKYSNTCYYCHEKGRTIDHVVPQSKGGFTTPVNCVWSCTECNEKKANMSQEEFKNC